MALVRTLASSFVDICCRGTPSISTLYKAETWLSSSARSYMSAIVDRGRHRAEVCSSSRPPAPAHLGSFELSAV